MERVRKLVTPKKQTLYAKFFARTGKLWIICETVSSLQLEKIFRNSALLIGSVKSNMGHAEPASGLCSIAKVLITMERGFIPPNLHYNEPNPYIPGLVDGRLQVSIF